jgi:predicted esterase
MRTPASDEIGFTAYAEPAPERANAAPPGEPVPAAPPRFAELAVPGFRAALVALPPDESARPVLVAAHGAGDTPEWQCEVWGAIVAGRGYVLCPRGVAMTPAGNGFFFPHHRHLGRELSAAVTALKNAYGSRVDATRMVYTGYSQGAVMGALVTAKRPDAFPRLALIEGGYAEWDVPTARAYKAGGGERVLLACGQGYCARGARKALRWLERSGVEARVEYVERAGHTYGGAVADRMRDTFGWLVAGDARWMRRPLHRADSEPP